MRDLKTASNKFMKEHSAEFPRFQGWGKSYCAITHSNAEKDMIVNYIKGQKEHHKKISFHDELLKILGDSGLSVDMEHYLKE